MKSKKILVIGGMGYIGSVLTPLLLESGATVCVLDNLLYQQTPEVKSLKAYQRFQFINEDFRNDIILNRALLGVTDVIILAGLVGDPICKRYPTIAKALNEVGMLHLIQFFHGKQLERVVFASTCSNYGIMKEGILADEDFPLNPLSDYARAKVSVEQNILALKNKVDYCATIVRFSTAFGLSSRMRFDLTINDFTRALFFKEKLSVFDAQTWRPYCHVKDLSLAILKILSAPSHKIYFEIFNVGGNNYNKQMIIDKIIAQLPYTDVDIEYTQKIIDQRNYCVSFQKILDCLSFEPMYSVENGIYEILTALNEGRFHDFRDHPNKYGNVSVNDKV